jgi:MFS family permease
LRQALDRRNIFYGWVIVAGLSVISAVNMSLGGVNFGSFIAPMRRDLGFDNTVFGLTGTVRTLATGIFSPYLGRLLDKHGSRYPLVFAGVAVMLLLVAMAFVQTSWQMLLLLALLGAIGMQGGASLYSAVPITRWFHRKRGFALSMAFVGGPIGLLVTLPGTPVLIDTIGWRATWAVFGVVGGLIIVLIALFLVRADPEEMGLLPDGLKAGEAGVEEAGSTMAPSVLNEYPWTRQEAFRTRSFWLLGFAYGISQIGFGAFVLFRIPYFVEKGMNPTVVGAAAASDAFVVVVGTFLIGLWIDRMSLHFGGALGVLLVMIALVIALFADNVALMFASNLVFGLGMVFNTGVRNLIWPVYYGRAHIGEIRGSAFMVQMFFGAIGSPLTGWLRDLTGDYTVAWLVAIVPLAISTVLIFFIRRPPTPGEVSGETRVADVVPAPAL